MPVTLATIRDREDKEVAHFEAEDGADDLQIDLIVSRDDRWGATLNKLPPGRLTMMINGVLCIEQRDEDGRRLLYLDEALAGVAGGELRLVYLPEGIEAAHQLRRRIARRQEFTVPFSELLDIVRQSHSK